MFTHSWIVLPFSVSSSRGPEYTHYIFVSDVNLCKVSVYESDLRKISYHFLENKAFFILPEFFTSVDSIT